MNLLDTLLMVCKGLTIVTLTLLIGGLSCILILLIETSQYGEEDTFYESH